MGVGVVNNEGVATGVATGCVVVTTADVGVAAATCSDWVIS